MSDVAPAAQPNPPKTPRKRTAPPTGISDQDMERFKTWIEDKSRYKSSGGFIPYLRKIMQDEDIEGLSTNNFHKKPRDGKRLVRAFALGSSAVISRWISFSPCCRSSSTPCGADS